MARCVREAFDALQSLSMCDAEGRGIGGERPSRVAAGRGAGGASAIRSEQYEVCLIFRQPEISLPLRRQLVPGLDCGIVAAGRFWLGVRTDVDVVASSRPRVRHDHITVRGIDARHTVTRCNARACASHCPAVRVRRGPRPCARRVGR